MSTALSRHRALTATGLLIVRIALGVIIAAHGWQKLFVWGVPGTGANFAEMGIPLPELSAALSGGAELLGGVLIALGLFTRVAGAAGAIDMAVAIVTVHAGYGIFASDGGWELVGLIGAASLALVFTGSGAYGIDNAIFGRRRRRLR